MIFSAWSMMLDMSTCTYEQRKCKLDRVRSACCRWLGPTYGDDLLGSSLGGEHGQDSSSASNVEDYLVLEEVLVPPHGVAVAERAHLVLEHLLVDPKVGVRVGIVVARRVARSRQAGVRSRRRGRGRSGLGLHSETGGRGGRDEVRGRLGGARWTRREECGTGRRARANGGGSKVKSQPGYYRSVKRVYQNVRTLSV